VAVRRCPLVYLTDSDCLIDGLPQNGVTAVPVDRSAPIPATLSARHA
jgi:CreA protein